MHATLQPTRERESSCEPSRSQTYRAVHILGPTIRSGQQTNEYSYILQEPHLEPTDGSDHHAMEYSTFIQPAQSGSLRCMSR